MNKLTIVAAVFVVAIIVHYVFRIWNARRLSPEQLLSQLIPVDLECFHALLRSMEARCLREMSGRDVRAVRRRFTLAAMDYVDRVRRNSAIYAQLATRASHSSDAVVAADARALAPVAFPVRLNATLAPAMLRAQHYARSLKPGTNLRLMRAGDGEMYVVKLACSSRRERLLATECLAFRLAADFGVPVPAADTIRVPQEFIARTPALADA